MERSAIRQFASEKALFFLTAQVLLIMPVSEILAEILTRYFKGFVPSFFHPLVFGAFGILGTLAVLFYKALELSENETRANGILQMFCIC